MKNFLRSIAGKTICFILCVITVSTLAAGAVSTAAIIGNWGNVYTMSEESFCREAMENQVKGECYDLINGAVFDGAYTLFCDNITVSIADESGNVISRTEDAEGISRWDYEMRFVATYDIGDDGTMEYYDIWYIYNENDAPENGKIYTVSVSLKDELTAMDDIALCYKASHFAYRMRYAVIWITVAATLLSAALFVILMSVSARRPGTEELYPGVLNKVPFDLLLAGAAILGVFPFAVTLDTDLRLSDDVFLIIAMVISTVIAVVIALGVCMSIAARIKQHNLWKNTVCHRVIDFLVTAFKGLCLAKKAALIVFGAAAVELVLLYIWNCDAEAALLWFLEKVIVIPLVGYIIFMLDKLKKGGEALASGDLFYHTDTSKMHLDFKRHGENLNSIASGMNTAVEARLKSERLKTELITNVSHDIKTPLTSIINYAALIGETPEGEKTAEYAGVLVRQSERLKRLLEDLVEASKASTGNLEVSLAPCDAEVFITQVDGEYEDKLKNADLTLITKASEDGIRIMADGRRMWRIFDNLMNNICKYALPGTRVYLSLEKVDSTAVITFKNTSREALDMTEDELMERFTRGDVSRNTEGSGLGLSIARSMAELQNGTLNISIDGDLFKAVLTFPTV